MLFTKSEEDEQAAGLDIIPGTVRWIPAGPKIPQMQWNRLVFRRDDPMFAGLGDAPFVYFVHSLHGVPDDPGVVAATVEYGTTLNAAFRADNVFAAQFHPEKSSAPGLRMLANFVDVCAASTSVGDVTMSSVELYPAIDLLGGRVVRLRTGDYDDQTVYGDDPVAVAREFAAAGARWIHVVDLDAAKTGDPVNRPVVAAIARAVGDVAQVQTGGGVRTLADAVELAEAGVARVVMGSAAVSDPSLVAEVSAQRAGGRRVSTIATASWRCTGGPRAAGGSSTTPTPCSRPRRRSSSPTSPATAC